MGIEVFKKHLREKRAIKISAYGDNFEQSVKICQAAQESRASAVDIPVNAKMYEAARKNTKLPLFASSIHPFELLEAVRLGVDAIQIGNYFESYKIGRKFSADEIYDITLETLGLINPYDVYTCVTVPATLDLDEQLNLIKKLQLLGIDLIQTEGYKKSSSQANVIIESAQSSIKNMIELSKNTTIPIMTSCDMNLQALKIAFNNGAAAVAVDNIINKSETQAAMKVAIMSMVSAISHRNSLNREIPKSYQEFSLN